MSNACIITEKIFILDGFINLKKKLSINEFFIHSSQTLNLIQIQLGFMYNCLYCIFYITFY